MARGADVNVSNPLTLAPALARLGRWTLLGITPEPDPLATKEASR